MDLGPDDEARSEMEHVIREFVARSHGCMEKNQDQSGKQNINHDSYNLFKESGPLQVKSCQTSQRRQGT